MNQLTNEQTKDRQTERHD